MLVVGKVWPSTCCWTVSPTILSTINNGQGRWKLWSSNIWRANLSLFQVLGCHSFLRSSDTRVIQGIVMLDYLNSYPPHPHYLCLVRIWASCPSSNFSIVQSKVGGHLASTILLMKWLICNYFSCKYFAHNANNPKGEFYNSFFFKEVAYLSQIIPSFWGLLEKNLPGKWICNHQIKQRTRNNFDHVLGIFSFSTEGIWARWIA